MTGWKLATAALGLLCVVTPAASQSLADVAKKEQARREAVAGAGKVYTNGDLTPDPMGTAAAEPGVVAPVSEPAEEAGAAAVPAADPAEPGAVDPAATEPGPRLDEAYWRRQVASRRARVEEAREKLARVSGPSEGNERQLARVAELKATAEGVLARAEASLAALEREARTLGVPEAWIR
ncbi:MAG: hypothetical protein Q8L86_02685 [Vicinamibacterales bacterium]|nr:hypothetical protein [Vicinamibacterales bacterium]